MGALDPRQAAQMCALAADDRDLRLVDLPQIHHVPPGHRDTSGVAVIRRAAAAGRITGVALSVTLLFGHVLIPGRLPSGESCGRHTRAAWAYPRSRTTGPTPDSTSPQPGFADNNTRTSSPSIPQAAAVGRRFCAIPRALPQAPR
ncbi:hypothetical protein GCM10010504_49940 [Streptomyces griseus]|nr:hypothetical protein GCM10010504_49940 [Streptomyces griseus]